MNFKASILALTTLSGFLVAAVPADAMVIITRPECRINCGDGGDGNPGYDPFCMFKPCKDDTADKPEEKLIGVAVCDAKLGELDKVTARQIAGIRGEDRVDVIPVCDDKNLMDQQKGVESIRGAIAGNDNMDEALDQKGFSADDVVGVVVGRTQAVLYVHAL